MEEYHQITINEWIEWKKRLRQELNNVRTAFVRVGYVLRKIDETEAYKVDGYKSVAEFAEKEHGLKPSTTSRWMAINREFSMGGYSEQLDERYLDMNASQLTEMLGLPMEDRELVTPGTSREELRELRRFNRDSESSGSGADASPMYGAFTGFLENNPSVAEKVMECLRGGNAGSEHVTEAVAPSGSRMYRAGTKFITFQESDIKVKVFGGNGAESVTWDEFAEIARQWANEKEREEPEAENGVRTAAVESPAESAGEESPEGSRGDVAESRGVDDERREEVSGDNQGQGEIEGTVRESGNDGSGDRTGDESGNFGGRGTEGSELSGECGGSEAAGDHQEDRDAIACGSGQDRGIGTAGREGREEDSKPGTDGSGTEEKAEVKGLREADDHCGERKEAAHLPGYAEDPFNQAEKEESRTGSLTDDFPAPEGVEDVENAAAEIAPAQFASATIADEDGDPAPEGLSFDEYWKLVDKATEWCEVLKNWVSQDNEWDTAIAIIDEDLRPLLVRLQHEDSKK